MNQEHNGLDLGTGDARPAQRSTSPATREPYATPRLTSYGRFQHVTGASLQGTNNEEVIEGGPTTEF